MPCLLLKSVGRILLLINGMVQDPILIWGWGHVCMFPRDTKDPRWLPERLMRFCGSGPDGWWIPSSAIRIRTGWWTLSPTIWRECGSTTLPILLRNQLSKLISVVSPVPRGWPTLQHGVNWNDGPRRQRRCWCSSKWLSPHKRCLWLCWLLSLVR